MGLARNILLWASANEWLGEHLPRYGFVRRAVRRFIPGETLEDALGEAERLSAEGIVTVLTFLGENVSSESEAARNKAHYLEVLERIAERDIDCHISIKLTQLGLDINHLECFQNLDALTKKAEETGNFVWIDMESSEYTDITIEQFRLVRSQRENVGICLQAYLNRTERDMEELLKLGSAVRLVKGAYKEPEGIAFRKKADVDEEFYRLSIQMLGRAEHDRTVPAFATHDESLIQRIIEVSREGGVVPAPFEIQVLYGIKRRSQQQWARDGHRVRVLISYGEAWYPWYVRRLAERPANVWFVLRNFFTR